jgi:hypothetical protein
MDKIEAIAATHNPAAFFSLVRHPLKLKLYLLANLPSAFFSGLKVVDVTDRSCTVSVPYKRFTKNPFRSTYFACLSMAAELSTGVLAMAGVYGRKPSVSMLLTGLEASFHKKATGLTFFTCNAGVKINDAIEAAIATRQAQVVTVESLGKNNHHEIVALFRITWSFRCR